MNTEQQRRLTLRSLLLLPLLALGCAGDSADSPPNVVLVSIDTLRADRLGCYGHTRDVSPAIDDLAAEGVRFANAFSQTSWTLPSHMSVMTSRYPRVHGVQNDRRALSDSVTTLAEVFDRTGYDTAAFVSTIYLTKQFGFSQGFDEYHELITRGKRGAADAGAMRADRITNEAIEWLRKPKAGPTFLFVHYFDPHMDYTPPSPFDKLFDADYQGPANGRHRWLSRYIKYFPIPPARIAERDLKHVKALYDGEIRYTDQQLGRLIATVKETLDMDNTIIVLFSDHGEEFDEHGSMEGHGWTLFDEELHVPVIVRLPAGAHGGKVVDEAIELIDVPTTILGLAGLSAPIRFQGQDHSPLILGDSDGSGARGKELIFAELSRHNIERQALRGERYKLIRTTSSGKNLFGGKIDSGTLFFDLSEDPLEQENRYDPENPIVQQFERLLDRKLERLSRRANRAPAGQKVQVSEEDLEILRRLGYVR
jgi:arylsulfatase A-like enzyme